MEKKKILWEVGTGYDLFASLFVLHKPEKFGLRPSWAAGVRSRLSVNARETLDIAKSMISIPMKWIHELSMEKSAINVLYALEKLAPEERLFALSHYHEIEDGARNVLFGVAERGAWNDEDRNSLRGIVRKNKLPMKQKEIVSILDAWADPEKFGKNYLEALTAYYQVFFAEEERHIYPYLVQAIEDAKKMLQGMTIFELCETLSHGVSFTQIAEMDELVIVPSYWLSPLVMFDKVSDQKGIFIFGARPNNVSLVPGDLIPAALLNALKALSDPTRMRILRYMTHEKISSAELARRLRLRAPTVTHHLNMLRLAGLVSITLNERNERHYQARLDAVHRTFDALVRFLEEDSDEH